MILTVLKRREDFVPIAQLWYEPAIDKWSPAHIGFSATVDWMIQIRQANPRLNLPTDRETCEAELENRMTQQLLLMPGGGDYLVSSAPPPPPGSFTRPLRRAKSAGAAAVVAKPENRVKAGIGLLKDFLGPTLKAVPHELAEKRATYCVKCPANMAGRTLDNVFGEGLRLLLEAKSDMSLFTTLDADLKTCTCCGCNNVLKIHVQLDYVLSKLTAEQRDCLIDPCWVRDEEKQLSQ